MEHYIKALIIDDEKDICLLLSRLLKQKNVICEQVYTLDEAKTLLKSENPEIIFIDNHLPDGLGINFIKEIKILIPSSKIVMITAHDTTADRKKAFSEGADYFIGKPFSKDVVYQILEACVC